MSWTSGDNGATYSGPAQTSVVTIKQGATVLATRTITGSVGATTGNITFTATGTGGTYTTSGTGTTAATATLVVSGVTAKVTGFSLNLGDLGKEKFNKIYRLVDIEEDDSDNN